jgi:hypothetical protein
MTPAAPALKQTSTSNPCPALLRSTSFLRGTATRPLHHSPPTSPDTILTVIMMAIYSADIMLNFMVGAPRCMWPRANSSLRASSNAPLLRRLPFGCGRPAAASAQATAACGGGFQTPLTPPAQIAYSRERRYR